jgi:hypothetical protein
MRACFSLLLLSLLLLGIITAGSHAQGDKPSSLVVQALNSPAGVGSGEPNIHRGADGRIYLTWIEKQGDKIQALRFAVFSGSAWSAPKTIIEGDNLFVNWADFPSLVVLPDGATSGALAGKEQHRSPRVRC